MGIRLIALVAALMGVAGLLAGCGGGDGGDSGDSGQATVSKAVFIREADDVCKRGGKQGEAELKAFVKQHKLSKGKEPNNVELAELGTDVLLPLLEQQRDEFHAIGMPRGDSEEVESFFNALDEAIENLKRTPTLAKSSPELLKRVNRLAQEYGFKVCG